jgi:N-methylhydantoinase B
VTHVVAERPTVYLYERVDVDPVTFEVVRHRLHAITDEQAVALASVSGSPLVNEATDFNTGLYRASGEVVTMGKTVIYHAASLSQMVRHIIADCEADPGIGENDVFIVNSPYKGALHAPDVGLLAPLFHEGQRIGWTGACAHQLDVGGMVPGGFASAAIDVRQEALLIPPLKLVEGGRLRSDVWAMITGMSRLPLNLGLDLKGMLAANNVARRRLAELIDRYGINVVLSVMDELIELSERQLRNRLRQLPDGRFRARTYLDHDGHHNELYRVEVTLTKEDDRLVFDYSASSPQAPGFVNCTYTGLLAGVYAGILPVLAYDLPWTDGIFRPVEVIAPPGLVCSAEWPAPVSQGPLGAMWLTEVTATEALSKLVASSPEFMREAQAAPAGGPDLFNVSGRNQYGEPAGGVMLDQLMTGGGAYAHRDGLSAQGQRNITAQKAPNVESLELIMPVLYLYRRLLPDTGGPGRHRGGQSAGAAYALHDVEEVRALVACHGYEAPNSTGLFGGYPGSCNVHRLYRNTDVQERLAAGQLTTDTSVLSGEEEPLSAKPGVLLFGAADVFEWGPQAGGGWGDPLEREPDRVAADVRIGAVTSETASRGYGVVLAHAGTPDREATERRRAEIRALRRAWAVECRLDPAPDLDGAEIVAPVGDRLSVVRAGARCFWRCVCGAALGPAGENWKLYAARGTASALDLGTRIRLHAEIEARQFACPACGLLHDVEIARTTDEPLFDVQLDGAR